MNIFELKEKAKRDCLKLKEKYDADYQNRMKEYNQQVGNLRLEKEKFRSENPDFPNIDMLFMNVIAPPQRIELQIIT